MGLISSCQGCGKGGLTSLQKVNGRYLCKACASNPSGVGRYYCTNCKSTSPYAPNRGNGWIEVVLYLFYIVPGIIYSIWRRSGNSKICPICKKTSLISAGSNTHVKCPDCAELVLREAKKCRHCGCALVPQ